MCRYMGQKTTAVDPYVEVRAGSEVFRTPSVHGSHQPAWNWDFDLRLPALFGAPGVRLLLHSLSRSKHGGPITLTQAPSMAFKALSAPCCICLCGHTPL